MTLRLLVFRDRLVGIDPSLFALISYFNRSLALPAWENNYDFDLRRGKVQRTQVPPALRASIVRSPPMTLALYSMFLSPIPSVFSFGPIPLPSSAISRTGRPARIASPIVMLLAPACFTAFVTASSAIRYRWRASIGS